MVPLFCQVLMEANPLKIVTSYDKEMKYNRLEKSGRQRQQQGGSDTMLAPCATSILYITRFTMLYRGGTPIRDLPC